MKLATISQTQGVGGSVEKGEFSGGLGGFLMMTILCWQSARVSFEEKAGSTQK